MVGSKENDGVRVRSGKEPGLGWGRKGVAQRKGCLGFARLEGGAEDRPWGRGGQAITGGALPLFSAGDLALGSVRCQEEALARA